MGVFLRSVPGILTGLATLITAVAGVVGVVSAMDDAGGSTNGTDGSRSLTSTLVDTSDDGVAAARWADEADALCTAFNEDLASLGQPHDAFEFAAYLDEAIALSRTFVTDIAALTAPVGDEADVERMIGLLERAIDNFATALSSLQNGDEVTANQVFTQALDANGRASEIARQLGAGKCAEA